MQAHTRKAGVYGRKQIHNHLVHLLAQLFFCILTIVSRSVFLVVSLCQPQARLPPQSRHPPLPLPPHDDDSSGTPFFSSSSQGRRRPRLLRRSPRFLLIRILLCTTTTMAAGGWWPQAVQHMNALQRMICVTTLRIANTAGSAAKYHEK